MKKIAIVIVLLFSSLFGSILSYYIKKQSDIPIIQSQHFPVSWTQQLKNVPHPGKEVFFAFCASCHSANPSIDVNAPKITNRGYWQMRKKRGIAALLTITKHGTGAMPARGGCFECSDENLLDAIEYMVSE